MAKLLTYEKKDTWMDELCGVTKLVYFLAWSITSMLTYDTRVLAVMLVLSFVFFKASKTEWKQVGSIFKVILFFLVVNVLAIFLFAPGSGSKDLRNQACACAACRKLCNYRRAAFL